MSAPRRPRGRARSRASSRVIGSVLGALADLVLPRTCAGCGVPGRSCSAGRAPALLARRGRRRPRRFPWGFPPTVAAGAYAGPVGPAVIAFKERGRAELAGPLGNGAGPRRGGGGRPPSRAARAGAPGAGAQLGGGAAQPRPGPRAGTRPTGPWPSWGGRAAGRRAPAAAPDAAGCATRPGCRRRSAGPTWPARSCRARTRPRPGGSAAGAGRRRRHQWRDAHRGGRGAGRDARPGRPPVLAAVVAATPRRREGRAGRPAGSPKRPRTSGGCSRSTVGTGAEGLASKRLHPSTGRSHGDRCPWS